MHDTTPIRIRTIAVADSTSATIELSQSLDPSQRLAPAQASLRSLPDSAILPIASLLPKPVDDSLHRPQAPADTTKADTAKAKADTAKADSARRARPGIVELEEQRGAGRQLKPLTSRPPLTDRLVLRVPKPWIPGKQYAVEFHGLRNVSGVAGDATGVLIGAQAHGGRHRRPAAPTPSDPGRTPSRDGRSRRPRDRSAA